MDRGYIKLFRKSLDSEVFYNPHLWQLWSWCLMKANRIPRVVPIKTGKGVVSVKVKSGQFIFGRGSAATSLGCATSTVWDRMKKLQKIGNIKIESNTQYSIVTICKWGEYQEDSQANRQATDRQPTGNRQATDTDKKEEKDKKKRYGENKNVLLTEDQYKKLQKAFNGECQERIDRLSLYISSHGKRYKCHYSTILSWAKKDQREVDGKKLDRTKPF